MHELILGIAKLIVLYSKMFQELIIYITVPKIILKLFMVER